MQDDNGSIDPANKAARFVAWNKPDLHNKRYRTNAIHSGKYDRLYITFVPIFLFDTFTRVAYIYFLIQVRSKHPSPMPASAAKIQNQMHSSCHDTPSTFDTVARNCFDDQVAIKRETLVVRALAVCRTRVPLCCLALHM